MSKRDQNVDDIVGENGHDGGREAFASVVGTRNRVQGMRAFVVLMCVIGIALIGWMMYRKMHPAQTSDSGPSAQSVNDLPQYNFATNPQVATNTPAPAASAPIVPQPTQQTSMGPGQGTAKHQPTPEELAYQRRLDADGASVQDTAGGAGDAAGGQSNAFRRKVARWLAPIARRWPQG